MTRALSAPVWPGARDGWAGRLSGIAPLTIGFFPYRLVCHCDDEDVRAAFEDEFFTTEPSDAPAHTLEIRVLRLDSDALTDFADRLCAAAPGEPVVGYDELAYRRVDLPGATAWIAPDENALGTAGNRHVIVREDSGWWVLTGDGPDSHRHGVIAAREMMRVGLLGRGGGVVHSSSVVHPRGAVLFSGDGGSGKTTLALASALGGMPLVSGDRSAVFRHDGRLWATGVGLVVRAREGTINGLGIRARLREVALKRSHPSKVVFTQPELSSVVGVATAVGAPMAAIVFTERSDGPVSLDPLLVPQAAALLNAQIIRRDNTWRPGWLSGEPAVGLDADAVAGEVQTWRLRWDPTQGNAEGVAAAVAERIAAGA